ncbi:hypothetical protein BCV69DRAFT_311724 [Microstroma glucosiphilum]|uniref:Chromo domain-containing protein n=1 Tax=Pseudomicrostroma glucosiphilum TaxID=1684307 RepID=A0A316UC46_9BASI|nr:hypothetical protein BCV69DRAFT_311724 [Pseudomicrostroma glucosiphilum]PWN22031.1 hypothetical protein BCV69DRAFT_311724 [Pseudomicrostroma glucosiphilum]
MPLKKGKPPKGKGRHKPSKPKKPEPVKLSSSGRPIKKPRWGSSSDDGGYSSGSSISGGSLHGSDSEASLGSWDTTDQVSAFAQPVYQAGQEFEIDAVLRWRRHPRKGYLQYRTAWTNFPIYDTTWEPEQMFDDRKIISRFWKRQGGRPDDVPPPPPSDDEGPVLDPGEETESLKLNKGAIGRQARKKLRREYRRDKVQLRRHWQTVGTKGAGAESDSESSSDLSSASSMIPRRKTRLAISDDEDDVPKIKRANALPRAESKARVPAASSDIEDDEDAHQVNSTLFVTPSRNTQNAAIAGRASTAQKGKRPAPSSSTLTSDSGSSDSDSDAVTAGPSCLAELQSVTAQSSNLSSALQAGTSAVSQSVGATPPQKPPLATPATSSSSSAAVAAARKKDRPLAAASLQRVKNQIKSKPSLGQDKASTTVRGPPTPIRPTADQTSGSTSATEAATATRASVELTASKAPEIPLATNKDTTAASIGPTTHLKAPPTTSSGSLLDLIAGPVNARSASAQTPSAGPAKSSGASGATPTDAAVTKGSFRGAHKNLSRIGLLPDAPPPVLAKRGQAALRGRGGINATPARADGFVPPSPAVAAAKAVAPSVATADKDVATGVSGVAAAAPSIGQTAPSVADTSALPQSATGASAAPSIEQGVSTAANAPVSFADEAEDFADLSVAPQAPPNKDCTAGNRGDASPARPSALPKTPTGPRADSGAEGSKSSSARATGSNAAPLGQPVPSPTWRNRTSQFGQPPPWQRDSWLERPKWWGQSHYASTWYAALQQRWDRQSRRSPPVQGSGGRHWEMRQREAAPHEPNDSPPAQPPPPPSSASSPSASAPATQSRPSQVQDPRKAKLIASNSSAGHEPGGGGNTSPRSPRTFTERNGSASGTASPQQPAPSGAVNSVGAGGTASDDAHGREETRPRAPQWMETWAKKSGAELVPPAPLRPPSRPPWEDQTRRAYARLPW